MCYFPEDIATSFITKLSQTVHLYGEWKVALNKNQFPCTFLHVRHGDDVLKFIDIKHDDEKDEGSFTAKEDVISNDVLQRYQGTYLRD